MDSDDLGQTHNEVIGETYPKGVIVAYTVNKVYSLGQAHSGLMKMDPVHQLCVCSLPLIPNTIRSALLIHFFSP